jgi:hypothetical protein
MRVPPWLPVLAAIACTSGDDKPTYDSGSTDTPSPDTDDGDGDGFVPPQDCDDTDPDIHPGAEDAPYDGIDADCGGGSDNDADGDGYDWDGTEFGVDCDDQNAEVNPGAVEACNGYDDDCDGEVDPPGAQGEVTWYDDLDADTWGDPATATVGCTPPPGTVDRGEDCDDAAAAAYPGAPTVACDGLDNDCDPATFEAGEVTLDGVPSPTLQDALESAALGQVVALCEGRYPVSGVVLDQGVTVVGAGAAVTLVDAEQTGPVLEVSALDPVILDGVTLTGGLGLQQDTERRGGGLYLHPGVTVDGTDLVLTGNVAGAGGGAWLSDGATLEITGGAITGNHADDAYAIVSSGGGVQAGANARLYLDDASIDGNDADMCGGASVGAGTLVDGGGTSTIAENATLGLAGGGICVDGSHLRGLEVARNHSQNRGGGIDGYDVLLEDVVVVDNTADLSGAGAALFGVCSVVDSTFTGNVAGIDGGGMTVEIGTTTVTSSFVTDNHATFFAALGGGVSMFQSTLSSVGTYWGGGKYANTPFDVGLVGSDLGFDFVGVTDFTCVDDGDAGTCE